MKCLTAITSVKTKNKKKETKKIQTFSKKEYKLLKQFFKPFLNICTALGYFILPTYQFNAQSTGRPDKRKAAQDSGFLG